MLCKNRATTLRVSAIGHYSWPQYYIAGTTSLLSIRGCGFRVMFSDFDYSPITNIDEDTVICLRSRSANQQRLIGCQLCEDQRHVGDMAWP